MSDYLRMVWTRRYLVVALVLLMAIPAAVLSSLQTSVYSSGAEIALVQRQVDANLNSQSSELSDTEMSTETAIVTGDDVTRLAVARGATSQPRATTTTKTNLIDLTAQAPSGQEAANTANAFADAYVTYRGEQETRVEEATVRQLTARSEDLQSQIDDLTRRGGAATTSGAVVAALSGLQQQQTTVQGQLNRAIIDRSVPGLSATVIRRALPPTARTSPTPVRDGFVAAVLGLILGVAVTILLGTIAARPTRRDGTRSKGPSSPLPEENAPSPSGGDDLSRPRPHDSSPGRSSPPSPSPDYEPAPTVQLSRTSTTRRPQ